jgi:primosomal protein N''
MADSGLFIGFGAPVRGREQQAIKVFNESFEYYSRLQHEGEVESFEPVLLEPHGGELGGYFLLRGDKDKLARIRGSEEFERLTARAELIVENLGIVAAFLGERLMSQMSVFSQQVEELT